MSMLVCDLIRFVIGSPVIVAFSDCFVIYGSQDQSRLSGYKTSYFMLNSTELEASTAHENYNAEKTDLIFFKNSQMSKYAINN